MSTRKVILKEPSKVVFKELELNEKEPLRAVWDGLGEADSQFRSHLIHKGTILKDEWQTLAEVFGACMAPVVYVVRNRSARSDPAYGNEEQTIREGLTVPVVTGSHVRQLPRAQPTMADPQDEVRCRICYSSENSPEDRLFRPCLCRGSMGLVHISCLNQWRERLDNPEAHFRCSNCGYAYRIARTEFAALLSSEEYVQAGALVLTLLLIGLVAVTSWLMLPSIVLDRFYEAIEWYPPDETYPVVRYLVFGAATLGLLGFLSELRANVEFVWHHGSVQALFGILFSVTAHGTRGLRVFSACGLAVAYRLIFKQSQVAARRILTRFGERVLEVTD